MMLIFLAGLNNVPKELLEAAEVDVASQLARIPEVQEVHHIAGEDCYLAKVRVADPEALGRLLRETHKELFASEPKIMVSYNFV